MQNLALTVSLLAAYYAFCDILLLCLIFYYRWLRRTYPERFDKSASRIRIEEQEASERTPLLTASNAGKLPRLKDEDDEDDEEKPLLARVAKYAKTHKVMLVAYTSSFLFLLTIGIVAWFTTEHHSTEPVLEEEWSTVAQAIGWTSAALYLGSRIPQIRKNMQTKCQGLSLMMFCFRWVKVACDKVYLTFL